ncbi:TPA: hypothetical protein N0F65_011918 [Lagenidium giganteum]|uniref:Uncharacterized protein n=1 Tax=Lagenidium giganteum TaxID=4803 RepID=A0AAV2YUD4_9STRA|nr:TPA: hypothetical protein N0F65_011918 [Lagenidium giganteum]
MTPSSRCKLSWRRASWQVAATNSRHRTSTKTSRVVMAMTSLLLSAHSRRTLRRTLRKIV